MFTRQRLHIRGKRKIKSGNRVMFARVEKASFLEPYVVKSDEKEEKRKYHFPYLHVFQIIQNGEKYYIIVNNQSIINHEGIRQTYRQGCRNIFRKSQTAQKMRWKRKTECWGAQWEKVASKRKSLKMIGQFKLWAAIDKKTKNHKKSFYPNKYPKNSRWVRTLTKIASEAWEGIIHLSFGVCFWLYIFAMLLHLLLLNISQFFSLSLRE